MGAGLRLRGHARVNQGSGIATTSVLDATDVQWIVAWQSIKLRRTAEEGAPNHGTEQWPNAGKERCAISVWGIVLRGSLPENSPPSASEVTMRAPGSTTAFGRLPWPQAPAVAQFHTNPGLDVRRAVQSPYTDKPFFATRAEPAGAAPTEVSFGPFRLLPTQFLLLEGDHPVRLGSRALEILIVLLERPGDLVSKQELMARVWPDVFVEPTNLTVHICALRRALRDGRDGNRFIINIPGRGYGFVAPVEASFVPRGKRQSGRNSPLILHTVTND